MHPTIFEEKEVRRVWHDEQWHFAVVDVIAILSGSTNPQVYWRVLKKRLIDEGSNETVTKCNGLKMVAEDGKMRLIDAGNLEVIFRIIQSIPSPKAEPFKQWLAKSWVKIVFWKKFKTLNERLCAPRRYMSKKAIRMIG